MGRRRKREMRTAFVGGVSLVDIEREVKNVGALNEVQVVPLTTRELGHICEREWVRE